jgi:hypothetical protein
MALYLTRTPRKRPVEVGKAARRQTRSAAVTGGTGTVAVTVAIEESVTIGASVPAERSAATATSGPTVATGRTVRTTRRRRLHKGAHRVSVQTVRDAKDAYRVRISRQQALRSLRMHPRFWQQLVLRTLRLPLMLRLQARSQTCPLTRARALSRTKLLAQG